MYRRRVLLTGRYGFTGRYVAEALHQSGWDVWGTGSHPAPHDDPQYFVADLTERDAIRSVMGEVEPDGVIHLAAQAFVAHDRADEFYAVNVIGTRNLLAALVAAERGQLGVILASSANVYGNADIVPIAEDAPVRPVNDYAVSKLSMEHMARLFHGDLPITIVRPFNYTGAGQDAQFLVPKIVEHFRSGESLIELGNLHIERDFSDVRDVANVYRTMLDNLPTGKTVNICSGRATSLTDILDSCRRISGHQIEVRVNPAFVRENEVRTLVGDTARLRALTGVVPKYALDDTLRWMLNTG